MGPEIESVGRDKKREKGTGYTCFKFDVFIGYFQIKVGKSLLVNPPDILSE